MRDPMDAVSPARSKEDIALDLLKFVAATAHVGSKGTSATGFGATGGSKAEDQVEQLFELYSRCRKAVEAPIAGTPSSKA